MAFFGLTALGPHPLESLGENTRLHLFTENDLEAAWKKTNGEDTLPLESLCMFLTELYHGSPPESEMNRLNGLVQECVNNGRIPWSALRKVFLSIQQQALQQEANKAPPSQRQLFTSNHDYRDAVRRHTSKGASEAKSTRSLTTNQAYGWKRGNESYNDGPPHKIRGKKSCPETLYCNELIKSGFAY